MKYIQKEKEPSSFTIYRQQKYAYFDGCNKDDLRKFLLKEQKYICCYCMQRISEDKMRIEHWRSQSEFPQYQLTYSNLFGACTGNEGKPKRLQHCDVRRENTPLTINPTKPVCEIIIKFRRNGEIYSDDSDINMDLKETLNLNYEPLRKGRKEKLDFAFENLRKKNKGTWSKDILQREIDKWENKNNEKYKAYCQIVIYHLKKKLLSVSNN